MATSAARARRGGAAVERLETRSLRVRAYEEIKRQIITLGYRPGEYLKEARISEELGIGRTPVHQALDRLMFEGMVEVIPRKGVIVRPVSLDEVMQLIEVRRINEPHAAALAAERGTEQEFDEIDALLATVDGRIEAQDLEGIMLLDREFHGRIAAAAKNRVLAEILRSLHERLLRFWFISLSDRDQMQRVQGEHLAVFRAIKARDPERAAQTIQHHIESFRDNIQKSL